MLSSPRSTAVSYRQSYPVSPKSYLHATVPVGSLGLLGAIGSFSTKQRVWLDVAVYACEMTSLPSRPTVNVLLLVMLPSLMTANSQP